MININIVRIKYHKRKALWDATNVFICQRNEEISVFMNLKIIKDNFMKYHIFIIIIDKCMPHKYQNL
jgi:hypothetical protein